MPADDTRIDSPLQLVGALGAAYMYTAYVHLSMVAEATRRGSWSPSACQTFLAEQRGLLEVVLRLAEQASVGAHTDDTDLPFLEILRKTARRLQALVKTIEDRAEQASVESAQQRAHQALRELLQRG